MPDILIRNFPAEDLALLDDHARRLRLSRTELLRRYLQREARRTELTVTVADLVELGSLLPDLADAETMGDAWS